MAFDTFMVLAASYADEADAIADYDAVHDLYKESGLIDTYDAAVISRDADGKPVKIVKKASSSRRVRAPGAVSVSAWPVEHSSRCSPRSVYAARCSSAAQAVPDSVLSLATLRRA